MYKDTIYHKIITFDIPHNNSYANTPLLILCNFISSCSIVIVRSICCLPRSCDYNIELGFDRYLIYFVANKVCR